VALPRNTGCPLRPNQSVPSNVSFLMIQRDHYIDRLRTALTALVVVFHTAITYGAIGGWFWYENPPSTSLSSILLTLFTGTSQTYFMGLFFLLAGYFTPASLERKGYARFIADRFLRLGLPLLAFGLILGPLTEAIVAAAEGRGFWLTILHLWQRKEFFYGQLWFVQALLIFSLGYCVWRAVAGAPLARSGHTPRPIPAFRWWLVSALGVAGGALAIRQIIPLGQSVFGMLLGYFSSYIFLFALGIAAWRYDWLRQLAVENVRPWIVILAVVWPIMPIATAFVHGLNGQHNSSFSGGFSWTAILYALWEPFVAWGLISLWLLVFRAHMNRPSALWAWLNRRAYAVYILHPPVLVGISLLLHGWTAPALVKFAVVGLLACIATWLVADPLVRLPGVRRVV